MCTLAAPARRHAIGSPRRPSLRGVTSALQELDADHIARWGRLAVAHGTPFLTPAWVRSYAAVLAPGRTWVVWAEDDGGLCAVTCLVESRVAGQRLLRFPGARIGGHFAIASRPDVMADAVHVVAHEIIQLATRRRAVVLLEHIDEDAPWWGAFSAAAAEARVRRLAATHTPVVDVPGGGWAEYLGSRSGEFRRQLGKKRRRAERDHDASSESLAEAGDVPLVIDSFVDLHHAAWRDRGGSALSDPRLERFVREACLAFHRDGLLREWAITMDGRRAASVIGFAAGDRTYLFQTGMDPEWGDRYSVGLLAYAVALETCMQQGAGLIDLGEGTQPYKVRFATRVVERADYMLTRRSDPRGVAVPAALALRDVGTRWPPLQRLEASLSSALRPGAAARTRAPAETDEES